MKRISSLLRLAPLFWGVLVALVACALPAEAEFGPDLPLTSYPWGNSICGNNAYAVATDSRENIHVIYGAFTHPDELQEVRPKHLVYDKSSGAWLPAFDLADGEVRTVCWWNTAIATDCSDNAHMLWVNWFDPAFGEGLLYRRRNGDGTWGGIESGLVTTPGRIEFPSIAADQSGNVYACWAKGEINDDWSFLYNIYYAVKDRTGSWTPPAQLTPYVLNSDPSPGATHPAVTTEYLEDTRETMVHLAWNDGTADSVTYTWRRRNVDTGAETPADTLIRFAGGPGSPSIAARCGLVHVVWNSDGLLHHEGGVVVAPDTVRFFSLPTGPVESGYNPNIAVDGLENLHMVMQGAGGADYANWNRLTAEWSPPIPVSDVGWAAFSPFIATDERGDLHVVWADGRGGASQEIYYDRGACMVHAAAPEAPRPFAVTLPLDLKAALVGARPTDHLPVILRLRERPDLASLRTSVAGLSVVDRRRVVLSTLQELARRSQASLLAELDAGKQRGEARRIRSLVGTNSVAAQVSPGLLRELAQRGDIDAIFYDPPQQVLDSPQRPGEGPRRRSDAEVTSRAVALTGRVGDGGNLRSVPADTAWGVREIEAPAVWAQGYRGQCILVGVIDSGADLNHTDLVDNLWINWGEIPWNGIDDDHNTYIDDFYGYDFGSDDGDPMDETPDGHGTHVAGIIAGNGADGTQTGVAPEAKLMVIKVTDALGKIQWSDVEAGLWYGLTYGAQILNLSLGSPCLSNSLRMELRDLADMAALMGITICAAAGNDNCRLRPPNQVGSMGDIPAPWIDPFFRHLGAASGVTTVGAVDEGSNAAPFSSRGPVDWSQVPDYGDWKLCDPDYPLDAGVALRKPDVCAPGMNITSTALGGGYRILDGTSQAAAHVTGLVALLLSKNPQWICSDLHWVMEATARDLGEEFKDNTYGAGLVNAADAIYNVPGALDPVVSLVSYAFHDTAGTGDGDGDLEPGETATLVTTLKNEGPYFLGHVVADLSTDPSEVSVLDGYSIFGDMRPGDVRSNDTDPFLIQVQPDVPFGEVLEFTLSVSSYGVCETISFQQVVETACLDTHDASGVVCSVTNQGIVGFLAGDHEVGSGFVFPNEGGVNRLFIGSLWAGTDSTYALNRDYDDDPVKDWNPQGCIVVGPGGDGASVPADEVGVASYTDGGHPASRGLQIVQQSYAWTAPPTDAYVILTYDAINLGPETISDLWLGLFMDWDLDETGGYVQNRGHVDAGRALVSMWREGGGDGTYVGIRSLSHAHPLQMSLIHNPTYVWPSAYLTDSDRYHFLSGDDPAYVVTDTPAPDDWSAVVGIAPFTLAPGESLQVGFALVAGSSLADLEANADAAAERWSAVWGPPADVSEPEGAGLPVDLELGMPSPNPFQQRTSWTFGLPGPRDVRLDVYDVAGRRVTRLIGQIMAAGRHQVTWDGRDALGRALSSGVYYLSLKDGRQTRTQKILLTR